MNKYVFLFFIVFVDITPPVICEEILFLDLKNAVYTGIKNNRELLFMGKDNLIHEKNINLKYRDYFPELKISYSDSATVAYYHPDSHLKKLSLSLTQELYGKGRKKAGIKLSKNQLVLKKLKTADAEEEYTFQVISSFKEILKLEMELSILENTAENTSLQLKIGTKELELGEITKLNFLEMEIAGSSIDLMLEKKKIELKKMIFSFSRLISLNPRITPIIEGKINTDYGGFLDEDADYFISASRKKSTAYREKLLAKESAYQNLKIFSRSELPEISTGCGFSMSGREFPLTESGIDLSVTFKLDRPGIPSSIKTGINKEGNNRSRSITAETNPFSDLENIHSEDSARIDLEKTIWAIEEFKKDNEFLIREMLSEIKSLNQELILLRKKLFVQKKKIEIEKLLLNLGEIKRSDFIESEIEFSNEKINLINSITSLYQKEISLLRLCGIKDIIRTGENLIKNHEKKTESGK
jgi:outer membrane protein TolC